MLRNYRAAAAALRGPMQFGQILGRPRISSTSKALTTIDASSFPQTTWSQKRTTLPVTPSRVMPRPTHARHPRRKRNSVKCASFSHHVHREVDVDVPNIACDSGCTFAPSRLDNCGQRPPISSDTDSRARHNGQRSEELEVTTRERSAREQERSSQRQTKKQIQNHELTMRECKKKT